MLAIGAISYGVIFVFWPYLQVRPIATFLEAIQMFAAFPEVHVTFFEGVYFGEDFAKLGAGEVEDMLLFQGLRDVIGGVAVILGAEFITSLKGKSARDYIHQLAPEEFTKLGLKPEEYENANEAPTNV